LNRQPAPGGEAMVQRVARSRSFQNRDEVQGDAERELALLRAGEPPRGRQTAPTRMPVATALIDAPGARAGPHRTVK
jgi:hypothetical protein